NHYFRASGDCYGCHGPDNFGPVFANRTAGGQDVNAGDNWRSTMMGNSARDPLWRAKVSHEITVNPGHQAGLEDKCTSCHAPMGSHDKHLWNGGQYSIAELNNDPIALDGIGCMACHMIAADSAGKLFSGTQKYDTNDVEFGPYQDLFGAPMANFVGYNPVHGEQINSAGLCAGCHTLITETADLSGNSTGGEFVEQATYHEWLNSVFNTDFDPEGGITCQGCHMPRLDEPIVISALYDFLTPRQPYGQHHFVGGNAFMLKLLKNNVDDLMLTSSSARFDTTIARTINQLQNSSLLLENTLISRDASQASFDVKLTNLAGHKFPSGYPSRRMVLEFWITDEQGNDLFHSGGIDNTYEVIGHDPNYEPHYDVITQEDQAQIYEMVMADVNGDKTTVLERAATSLKDNRLPPKGFTSTHYAYDTCVVAGVSAADIDFNRNDDTSEGAGSDIVHYQVALNGYTGALQGHARVWYQSVPPRWLEEMFQYHTAPIDSFRTMYNEMDGTPVIVRVQDSDISTGADAVSLGNLRIFPNPVHDGVLRIEGISDRIDGIEVFDMSGALVAR
ncbi:MAG TPA: multiheme c-type cytochrome, partial [Flavobacteriales bacterium]|nr:multiheme c-type cytochrome [Flavobacteriales bacterium]